MKNLRAVHVDGLLFFFGSFFGSVSGGFASDGVYQYVNAHVVFWIRVMSAAISTSCISLITFRSQTYAKWLSDGTKQTPVDSASGLGKPGN